MLALALEEGILATFKHHYYSFDQGEVRLQQEGGPIGLKISGSVGKVVMLAWVREYKARMVEATSTLPGMEQYIHQLYVDDNNSVMEELPPGTRLVEGRFQLVGELVEEDRQVPGDKRTGKLANTPSSRICRCRWITPPTTPWAGCPSLTWRCRWPGTRPSTSDGTRSQWPPATPSSTGPPCPPCPPAPRG
jgi:hypothetical protein